jgi:hypothetical protein
MNSDLSNKYHLTMDHVRISENFSVRTKAYLQEKAAGPAARTNIVRKYCVIGAVSLLLVIVAVMTYGIINGVGDIPLTKSNGNVHVKYASAFFAKSLAYSRINLTEEQIFTDYSSLFFKGEVTETRSILINIGQDWNEYWSMISIRVIESYDGALKSGDNIEILMPCPIGGGFWASENTVAATLRVGSTGIFMPKAYDDTNYLKSGKDVLYLSDICAYGLYDGERFLFLENGSDAIYAEWAYPNIPKAPMFDEIEAFVREMVRQVRPTH